MYDKLKYVHYYYTTGSFKTFLYFIVKLNKTFILAQCFYSSVSIAVFGKHDNIEPKMIKKYL